MANGIYLHVPFCRVRCPYCDFNAYAGLNAQIPAYVDALIAELRMRLAERPAPLGPSTLYFGGGTPSLLDPEHVARIVTVVRQEAGATAALECTLEANPGTVDRGKLAEFAAAGVTRLTIGGQTFDPALLERLGRIHTVDETRRTLDDALAAGFRSLNLDLMYALPGQTMEGWRRDLAEATERGVPHLSLYNLTIEAGTPFFRQRRAGRLTQPPEELQADMLREAWRATDEAGLARYEVSNFARPGHECRHNQLYWRSEGWLGVGAGAHGFDPAAGSWGRRWWNLRPPGAWREAVVAGRLPEDGHELLGETEARLEAVMLGLRTRAGLDRDAFARRFGPDPARRLGSALDVLSRGGLVRVGPQAVKLTEAGEIIADSIIKHLGHQLDTPG